MLEQVDWRDCGLFGDSQNLLEMVLGNLLFLCQLGQVGLGDPPTSTASKRYYIILPFPGH